MQPSPNPYESPHPGSIPGTCTSNDDVTYEFTVDDWVHFVLRQNAQFQEAAIRQRRRLFLVVAMIAAATMVGLFRTGAPWLLAAPMAFVALFLVYRALGFARHYRQRTANVFRKMLEQKTNRGVLGLHRMQLTPQGLRGTSPGGSFELAWWAVAEIERSDEYVYLFVSSMNAHLIPQRAFATPEHFTAYYHQAQRLWKAQQAPPLGQPTEK